MGRDLWRAGVGRYGSAFLLSSQAPAREAIHCICALTLPSLRLVSPQARWPRSARGDGRVASATSWRVLTMTSLQRLQLLLQRPLLAGAKSAPACSCPSRRASSSSNLKLTTQS